MLTAYNGFFCFVFFFICAAVFFRDPQGQRVTRERE